MRNPRTPVADTTSMETHPPPPMHASGLQRVKRSRLGERTMLACIGCKQKKLKCDGKIPQCRNCLKNNRQCLIEDPATGLHRPRDYVKSLENRVQYLENLLNETGPDLAAHGQRQGMDHSDPIQGNSSNADGMSTLPGPESESAGTHRTDSLEQESVDELSADVALLCVRATGREPAYFGPSSAVVFSRVMSSAMKLPKRPDGTTNSSVLDHADLQSPETTPSLPTPTFPPPAMRATLCKAYLENIHPQYPFLHWPTFLVWQELCVSAHNSGTLNNCSAAPLFFVWIIYAIAARALGPTYYTSAESYYSMALGHQAAVLDLDSLESVQSLLACGVYSIRSPVGPSLWKISGMAMRQCVELGYHRSVARVRRNSNPLVSEISKRCFWVAYDLDRQSAFILGRPVGIPDDCIDVELPLDVDDKDITPTGISRGPRSSVQEPYTDMTGALHVIKLRQLWSKINHFVYPPLSDPGSAYMTSRKSMIEILATELEDWHSHIPDLVDPTSQEPISIFSSRMWFQLAYSYSTLILYRSWIVNGPMPGEDEYSDRVYEICYNRSREMCASYRRLYSNTKMQFTWGLVHILFLGGMTFIYCIWKSPAIRKNAKKMDVINTCMACHTVLVIIAERWNHATAFRDIFEVLSERTIDLVCSNDPLLESNGPTELPLDMATEISHLPNWIMDIDDQAMPADQSYLWELLNTMGVGVTPNQGADSMLNVDNFSSNYEDIP